MSQDNSSVSEDRGIAEANLKVATNDPDYIVYLLDPEQEYNCYFVVGPTSQSRERIGVVKKMLLAHSVVFRAELQASKIAEKNDVKLIDLYPETFKNLLRFVYGYDNTQDLSFEEADNLLYAADKYMMPKLKNKLATVLMSMLDYNNVCSLMNNPACYSVLELNAEISKILQWDTDQVLASPQFLHLNSDGFLKILEQEIANCSEIELWRAAIKWAEEQGRSRKSRMLRNKLTKHLQHIRFCSMTNEDILMEVMPTKVLTYDELILVGESRRTGIVQPNLTTICNVIEERESPKSEMLHHSLPKCSHYSSTITTSSFKLKTQDFAIELNSVKLYSGGSSAHMCNCSISIQKYEEPSVVSKFEGQIGQPSGWVIPTIVNNKYVLLSPNSSYLVTIAFHCPYIHQARYISSGVLNSSGNHFSVDIESHSRGIYQVDEISYKTINKKVTSQSVQHIQRP